jgi:hypothetical protein
MAEVMSLERVFTSPKFFGIENATPAQRAICRIIDGLPLGKLADHPDVRELVGGDAALAVLAQGGNRPREVDVLAAIRTGKSILASAFTFCRTQSVDCAHVAKAETIRGPVLSVNLRSAEVTFNLLSGTALSRASMKPLMVGEPAGDSFVIRHPSGRHIECSVAAGARAGANLVSVWLSSVVFEEFSRQASESQGAAINYEAQLAAAAGRLLEGGQILSVGSPWAPFGAAYERYLDGFGKPTPERVVLKGTGPMLNPAWWTPARCAALERSNPTAYQTDVLANFADQSVQLIPSVDLERATTSHLVIAPVPGATYLGAMDPATRGNEWSLVILRYEPRDDGTMKLSVVFSCGWQGSSARPLRPDEVCADVARVLDRYNLSSVWSDQHAPDFLGAIAQRHGFEVEIETVTGPVKTQMFENLRTRLADGSLELTSDPAVLNDLKAVRRIVTRSGVAIDLPRTPDGRHCDHAAALALAVSKAGGASSMTGLDWIAIERKNRAAGLLDKDDQHWSNFADEPSPLGMNMRRVDARRDLRFCRKHNVTFLAGAQCPQCQRAA